MAAVRCSYLRSGFASGPEFTNEADTFVKAAATLKSKPSRVEQVKAFAESKEAARAIAEKMSGEAINWSKEETKARNNLKRKMMEWGEINPLLSLLSQHCREHQHTLCILLCRPEAFQLKHACVVQLGMVLKIGN